MTAGTTELRDTLDAAAAASRTWDAVVVGAGPAGALTALLLAREGLATLLVDKARFPRGKVCGCCLNARALDALAGAGLGSLPGQLGGQPLHRVAIAAGGRTALLRLSGGVALSREALDAALVAAARDAGAALLTGVHAESPAPPDGAPLRAVILRAGGLSHAVNARVIIAADGLGGRLDGGLCEVSRAARLGAGTVLAVAPDDYGPGCVFMACGRGGYVGLVRLEDGRLDVAAALDRDAVERAGGLGPAASRIVREVGLPELADLAAQVWHGTPALTRRARRLAGERLFAAGDAAGFVEPFTGEGIGWALTSATALAPIAAQAARGWDPRLPGAWERRWRRAVRTRQRSCRMIARLLRHPAAVALAVRLLTGVPALSTPLLRHVDARAGTRRA